MDSMSKIMRRLCLLLVLAVFLKGSDSNDELLSKNDALHHTVTVEITNKLHPKALGFQELSVHCKDKHHDLGPVTLKFGGDHRFDIYDQDRDYYCHHALCYWEIFDSGPCGGDHRFDIYVQDRDMYCNNNLCSWQITEKRPCDVSYGILSRKCYEWDKSSPEK
ncbi:hypothetical protein V8G54_013273 [Vigna mungo]|uniref:S-protein homolog n=1 Tax=Vigna mungo TaxID=3915 RepID=A0AAQ3S342_VIGMU